MSRGRMMIVRPPRGHRLQTMYGRPLRLDHSRRAPPSRRLPMPMSLIRRPSLPGLIRQPPAPAVRQANSSSRSRSAGPPTATMPGADRHGEQVAPIHRRTGSRRRRRPAVRGGHRPRSASQKVRIPPASIWINPAGGTHYASSRRMPLACPYSRKGTS